MGTHSNLQNSLILRSTRSIEEELRRTSLFAAAYWKASLSNAAKRVGQMAGTASGEHECSVVTCSLVLVGSVSLYTAEHRVHEMALNSLTISRIP